MSAQDYNGPYANFLFLKPLPIEGENEENINSNYGTDQPGTQSINSSTKESSSIFLGIMLTGSCGGPARSCGNPECPQSSEPTLRQQNYGILPERFRPPEADIIFDPSGTEIEESAGQVWLPGMPWSPDGCE